MLNCETIVVNKMMRSEGTYFAAGTIFKNLQSYTLLSNTNYLNKVVFAIEPMSNTSIKFFKRDEMQNYTNSNDIINCIFE